MEKKSKKKIPVIDLFPHEYKVYSKRDYSLYVLLFLISLDFIIFLLSYLILSQTGSSGEGAKESSGKILIIIGVIILIITILWSIRNRIITFILSFTFLVAGYESESIILQGLGLISQPFSWGIVTVIIITSFAYWMGTKLEWDDSLKVILLFIVAYLINVSGWLSGANNMFSSTFSLKKMLEVILIE